MKIIVDKQGCVDFEYPIYVTDTQRSKIIAFMEELFPGNVKTRNIQEVTRPGFKQSNEPMKWTSKDFLQLLSPDDMDTVAKSLNRSSMSIQMMRGQFLPAYMKWLKKMGYRSIRHDERLLQEFLESMWGEE